MSFHESFRLNGTDGFYTVMNIPVVVNGVSNLGTLQCTLNAVDANIPELIPIPPPLTKIDGEIVPRFTGTNADQQGQFENNESPADVPETSNGQVEISVVPSIKTLIETATVQINSSPPQQTALDGSDFGGPGGDLTDELNNNALVVEQTSSTCGGRVRPSEVLFVTVRLCTMVVLFISYSSY